MQGRLSPNTERGPKTAQDPSLPVGQTSERDNLSRPVCGRVYSCPMLQRLMACMSQLGSHKEESGNTGGNDWLDRGR